MSVKKNVTVPVVALRGIVLFPDMTLHFDVGRKESIAALRAAMHAGQDVFFVTQKGFADDYPDLGGLHFIGVLGEVRQIVRIPGAKTNLRVVVDGKQRGCISEILQSTPYLNACVELLEDEAVFADDPVYLAALLMRCRSLFEEYCMHSPQLAEDVVQSVYETDDPGVLADKIAGNILFPIEIKQELLSIADPMERLEYLCVALAQETEILALDEDIQSRVQEAMDRNQKEYYLREQMRIIEEELGENEGDDIASLRQAIADSAMSEQAKKKLFSECRRLQRLSPASPDANVLRTYIEKCLEIPWGKYSKEKKSISAAVKVLEKDHYGLKDVKERITEMLAARIVSPQIKGQIICLAGPPGVGKTSIAKSIATATGRNYARMSLGGVRDEAEIRGHRRTYIGSIPGRLIDALVNAGTMNPLILLDEVDKLSSDIKGDPASALLEALDAEQNHSFRDHYIELPVDLSQVLFITTANDKNAIPDALRDRMEVIDIASYTYEEKFQIAKKHLLPKQMKEHALTKNDLRVTDAALRAVIEGYTREAGVRRLERQLAKICRKKTLLLANGETEKTVVDVKDLEKLLGIRKYRDDAAENEDSIGVVNGLAWTSVGGELLKAEALVFDGTGKLETTGSLGDVMVESVKAAVSFIRSRCYELNIAPDFYKTKDIHVHFPEGAVPKDGPSAGITVTTALVSALTNRPVSAKIAMTGEVTLRGRVLAIGGLREKAMAAYRMNIPTVIIPAQNLPDLQEVDDAVKERITFIPVKTVDEVLSLALCDVPVREQDKKSGVCLPPPENYGRNRGVTGELQ